MMSTNSNRARSASQIGPSPSWALTSKTSSGVTVRGFPSLPHCRIASLTLSRLPTSVEQPDPPTRTRMLLTRVVIQLHSKARPIGRDEAAVGRIDLRRTIDELVRPRISEVVEVLEHLVVWCGDREVQVGHRADRTADV